MEHIASHAFALRAHARARVWIVVVALGAVVATGPAGAAETAKQPVAVPTTKTVPPSMRKETMRTLEAIHIEGEVAVPQVLFITARDARRFRDGLGSKYQKSATDVAQSVSPPHRLRVVARHELNP